MDFVAIDVETANQHPSSICQIGIAVFSRGRLVSTWGTLVNPEDSFLPFNIQLHGIRPCDVVKSPTWVHVQSDLRSYLEHRVVASHTYFDRGAMAGANGRYGVRALSVPCWIDTCQTARTAWPHLPNHKLTSLARTFGIVYGAHDATEDARCAGEILILAALGTGLSLDQLSGRQSTKRPLGSARRRSSHDSL
jgi:DNA polymerase-3 subunit epsilon